MEHKHYYTKEERKHLTKENSFFYERHPNLPLITSGTAVLISIAALLVRIFVI